MRDLLERLEQTNEESYVGNLGAVEMMKFYMVANKHQQDEMERLLSKNKITKAWELLKRVTGVNLKSFRSIKK